MWTGAREDLNGPRNFLRHQTFWPPPRSGCLQRESLFSGALKTSLRLLLLRTGMICTPNLTLLEMWSGRRATASYSAVVCVEELLSGTQSCTEARVNQHNRAFCLFSCLGWKIVYPIKYDNLESFVWPQATSFWPIRMVRNWSELRKRKHYKGKNTALQTLL